MKLFMVLFLYLVATASQAQTPEHGKVKEKTESNLQVWNSESSEWTNIDSFWLDFANSNDAKFWG